MSANPKAEESILLREDRDGICTLVMNRPQQMNLLTSEMLDALQEAFDAIAGDNRVRVVVLGASGKGFCAGHDIKEIRALKEMPKIEELFAKCSRMMQTITSLPQPVIARVQGPAVAAGCQLVAACDLAVAATEARFATPGVKIGLFCSTPMVPLSRAIGRKRALEMLLTGVPIDAATALEWGLVNRVVPAEALDASVGELVAAIAQSSGLTVGIGKRAFYDQIDLDEARAYDLTKTVMSMNMLAADAQEGICAFLEKREPTWTGR